MSIQGKVNELNSIKNELHNIRQKGIELRKRLKVIEKDIDDYLEINEQPGLKYKGTAIIRETVLKKKIKKKIDLKIDTIKILESKGINNAEKVYEELINARHGSPTEQKKLRFKKINKE